MDKRVDTVHKGHRSEGVSFTMSFRQPCPIEKVPRETIVKKWMKLFHMKQKSHMKDKSQNKLVGKAGEDAACRFLEGLGHIIVVRNYSKRFGELDIVSKKDGVLHFGEVKSVSCGTLQASVSCRTSNFRPEDNVTREKKLHLSRIIETYLLEKNVSYETEYQCDVISVYLDRLGNSKIELFEDIEFD